MIGNSCIRHANERNRREYFDRLAATPPGDRSLDLRGVEITNELLQELGTLFGRLDTVDNLLMSNAVLHGDLDLHGLFVADTLRADGVEFRGNVRIRGCQFRHAHFMGSEFVGVTRFGAVDFLETCSFRECTFGGMLFAGEGDGDFGISSLGDFAGASFKQAAIFQVEADGATLDFSGSDWQGDARLEGVQVEELVLRHATFGADLSLTDTKVGTTLGLYNARIEGYCDFNRVRVKHLDMTQAQILRAPELGEIRVVGWAVLDQAVFEQQVRLRIAASTLHCHRTIFKSGVSMSLAGDLVADGSFFPPPSDISGVGAGGIEGPPRVWSLRRADVGGLSISNVDLSSCLFAGVHHLESSRLGAGLRFARPPGGWRSPRDVLGEEQWLRSGWDGPRDWRGRVRLLPRFLTDGLFPADAPPTLVVDRPVRPDASSVAETYRSLRKAREEGKDSPGAAAFYYGEIEMRRRALRGTGIRDWAERSILWVYWALSGYGLRAWRSLLTLAFVMALASFLLWKSGFKDQQSFGHAARVAVASATSLVRPIDDSELDGSGFAIEIALRFLGPVLLALSALALRARIKR